MKKTMLQNLALFAFVFVVITLVNVIGYNHTISETVVGSLMLVTIGFLGITISNFMNRFIKLPRMLYVSLLGLLLACPISPVAEFVIAQNNMIAFQAPCVGMGCFAGIALGKDVKTFLKMGWKFIVLTIFIIAGTYLGSALVAEIVLRIMGH